MAKLTKDDLRGLAYGFQEGLISEFPEYKEGILSPKFTQVLLYFLDFHQNSRGSLWVRVLTHFQENMGKHDEALAKDDEG